jgi:hypothetical protein
LAGTLLYLVLLALMLSILLAIILLPVMALLFHMWRRKSRSPDTRGRALVDPGKPLLSRLENSNC